MDGNLTDQQQRFVIHLASDGVTAAEAARRAGYSERSAKEIASQLMRKPHIVAALQKEQARVLGALGGKALRVIGELLDDPDAPAGVRLDAAKATLDRIGLVAARTPAQSVATVNDRPMNEWTTDELHAYLAALNVMKREQASEEPAALN